TVALIESLINRADVLLGDPDASETRARFREQGSQLLALVANIDSTKPLANVLVSTITAVIQDVDTLREASTFFGKEVLAKDSQPEREAFGLRERADELRELAGHLRGLLMVVS